MNFKPIKRFFQALALAPLFIFVYFNIVMVPAQHFGLLKEQTLGYQTPLFEPGWHWLWTGFVPEKWRVMLIAQNPPTLDIHFKQGLRYSDYLELSDKYRVVIHLRLKYEVKKDNLFSLMTNLDDNPSNIEKLVILRSQNLLELKFHDHYQTDADIVRLRALFSEYLNEQGENGFIAQFNTALLQEGISASKVSVENIYVPDLNVYLAQTANIGEVFAAQRQSQIKKILNEADLHKQRQSHLIENEDNEKTARLLRNDPQLLQYLKYKLMNKEASVVVIDSPAVRSLQDIAPLYTPNAVPLKNDTILPQDDKHGQLPVIK